ncbi:MAG TPA: sugar phosphate nucleotidyltransferase [Phycisphaerae bacterium]|nr:sugar phosphate nucleotidyltransferase [Phycisphaerae bacterium]
MVRKAVIPMAGLGTRLGPLARVISKGMFPLADEAGVVRPVMHTIAAEAVAAGIEQLALIVSPDHAATVRRYVEVLAETAQGDLARRVEIIIQDRPGGLGQAALCAADFVGDEAFMLLLGDHVCRQDPSRPRCAAQALRAFEATGGSAMVAVQVVGPAELHRVGVARGEPVAEDIYRCTEIIEKPDVETARARLATPRLPDDSFLAHFGIYVFGPEIFDCLSDRVVRTPAGKETGLTEAQQELLRRAPGGYFLVRIAGQAYDIGTPAGYVAAQAALSKRREDASGRL